MKNFYNRYVITALCAFVATVACASAPKGYYSRAVGKSDAELKAALRSIIYQHTQVSSYNALPSYFQQTDVYPGTSRWWDMYSNIPLYLPWNGKYLNREHSFPKSWWGGGDQTPAYTDLNHLYPGEVAANMAKSNWPLGEVATPTFDNDWSLVGKPRGDAGGADRVFEPNNEYKGDFARTYFYMVTCYTDLTWVQKYAWMLQQNDYPTLKPWASELLLKWSREDPVSQKEIDRNEQVYKIQNNRNPFIDYPELAEYIWGNRKGQLFYIDVDTSTDPTLYAPVQNMVLDFDEVAIGNSTTSELYINGAGLTSDLRLTVYTGSTAMFKLEKTTVSYRDANSEAGTWVKVTYQPTELGTHESRLIVSGGGQAGSVGVALKGQCLPVPTLSTLVATDASEIDTDSYVANWNVPTAGSEPDYYVVTRTRHIAEKAFTEEILAETNSVLVDNFADSEYDTYSVQSVALGYRSEPSNVITVRNPAGIEAIKAADSLLEVTPTEGGIFIECGRAQTSARIIDLAGRSICTLPQLHDRTEVALPSGVYIVIAPGTAPVKVTVR